jgi:hypothetical protein
MGPKPSRASVTVPQHLPPLSERAAKSLVAILAKSLTDTTAADGCDSGFELEVDPEGRLDPAERARRAEHPRKAHLTHLAHTSAKTRRRRSSS